MSRAAAEKSEQFRVDITSSEHGTALAYRAAPHGQAGVTLILAHGAGANQTSGFMVHFATAFAARGIDTVTFNFVYSQEGRRVPDRNDKLESCYRKVIDAVRGGKHNRDNPPPKLVSRGQSVGGRHAAPGAAASHHRLFAPAVFGYSPHPPGRPDK